MFKFEHHWFRAWVEEERLVLPTAKVPPFCPGI